MKCPNKDRKTRAETAAQDIESWLNAKTKTHPEHLREGWKIAKRWYRAASERAAKPCYVSMG
jgi:hypothetical protein